MASTRENTRSAAAEVHVMVNAMRAPMLHEGRRGQLSRHQLSSCSVYVRVHVRAFESWRSSSERQVHGHLAEEALEQTVRLDGFDGGKLCHQIRLQVPFGKVLSKVPLP